MNMSSNTSFSSKQSKKIPFFAYTELFRKFETEYMTIFQDVCSRGAFIQQKDLTKFESNLASFVNAKYALGVANGTDALIMSLKAAGIKPGDEVIFCSHTFVATAASIHHVGAIPVPVECGRDRMIDPTSVEIAVTSKTTAIMPTQLNGRTADMDALQKIADKHGILIVEDAAQGLGSKFKGKFAGTFGITGTISFYPAKNLGCFGDGGAIITNDDDVYEKLLVLRDHGRNHQGEVVAWGYNSRLDNLQAAILDFKLSRYYEEIDRRRRISSLYQKHLSDITEIGLPPSPETQSHHFDVYQNYEIEAEDRDELKLYLQDQGIGTIIQWGGKAVHQFAELNLVNKSLPFTENFFTRCLMLPMNTTLSDEDIIYICDKVRGFYKGQH